MVRVDLLQVATYGYTSRVGLGLPRKMRGADELASAERTKLRQMPRSYTIREAAEITTKSYAALRGMVDRGQLQVAGGGKSGRTRRIAHDELKRAGLLRVDEILAEPAVQELSLQLSDLSAELRQVEARLSQQLARIEVLLAVPSDHEGESGSDEKPELRAV